MIDARKRIADTSYLPMIKTGAVFGIASAKGLIVAEPDEALWFDNLKVDSLGKALLYCTECLEMNHPDPHQAVAIQDGVSVCRVHFIINQGLRCPGCHDDPMAPHNGQGLCAESTERL